MVKKTPPMNGYPNLNCVQRETCLSPRTKRQRTLAIQRARQIMELPLEYVPNQQFEALEPQQESRKRGAWSDAGRQQRAGRQRSPSPTSLAPYLASLYAMPLLTREQEVHLFRKLNYLKYKTNGLRAEAQSFAAAKKADGPDREALPRDRRHAEPDHLRQFAAGGLDRQAAPGAGAELLRVGQRWERVADAGGGAVRLLLGEPVQYVRHLGNHQQFRPQHSGKPALSRLVFVPILPSFSRQLPDVSTNQHELEAAQSRREIALDGILRRLDDREREIIICRFGLRRGYQPQTLQQLGDVMGVSRERIRQIESPRAAETAPSYGPGTAAGSTEKGIS